MVTEWSIAVTKASFAAASRGSAADASGVPTSFDATVTAPPIEFVAASTACVGSPFRRR